MLQQRDHSPSGDARLNLDPGFVESTELRNDEAKIQDKETVAPDQGRCFLRRLQHPEEALLLKASEASTREGYFIGRRRWKLEGRPLSTKMSSKPQAGHSRHANVPAALVWHWASPRAENLEAHAR